MTVLQHSTEHTFSQDTRTNWFPWRFFSLSSRLAYAAITLGFRLQIHIWSRIFREQRPWDWPKSPLEFKAKTSCTRRIQHRTVVDTGRCFSRHFANPKSRQFSLFSYWQKSILRIAKCAETPLEQCQKFARGDIPDAGSRAAKAQEGGGPGREGRGREGGIKKV